MKKIITLLFFSILLPSWSFAADISLIVEGVQNQKGEILVSLSKKDSYLKTGWKNLKIHSLNNPKAIFQKVPEGTYAITIFHDENSNGELDSNFIGIPKEGYGFSNNATGTFGPPSFEDASFQVSKENKEIKIKLSY